VDGPGSAKIDAGGEHTMGARVGVAGASGYAGGELLRLLTNHPDLEIGPLAAGSNAGVAVTAVHPNLIGLADRTFGPTDPAVLGGADLVFMALPHAEAAALATELPAHTKVVDLGAGFRLADPASWAQFYGGEHPGHWTYGLPELPGARAQIRASAQVASPGCYATSSILALAPLLASGLGEPSDIVIVAASGTSGAGRAPASNLLGSEVMGSVSAYQVGGVHRHTPEIEEALQNVLPQDSDPAAGQEVTISFTPTLAPMPRGILATATARLTARARQGGSTAGITQLLRAAFDRAYGGERFVHLLPEGQWPGTGATAGSNAAHLQVAADLHAGRAVAVAAIDNLGKGAAGQALQNANLMLGLPEAAGLTAYGVAP
jgi:N-acetyl-gamma-glutamyl-phosphate reductase